MNNKFKSNTPQSFLTNLKNPMSQKNLYRLTSELNSLVNNIKLRPVELLIREKLIYDIKQYLDGNLLNASVQVLESYKNGINNQEIEFVICEKEYYESMLNSLDLTLRKTPENKSQVTKIFMDIKNSLQECELINKDTIIYVEKFDPPMIRCRSFVCEPIFEKKKADDRNKKFINKKSKLEIKGINNNPLTNSPPNNLPEKTISLIFYAENYKKIKQDLLINNKINNSPLFKNLYSILLHFIAIRGISTKGFTKYSQFLILDHFMHLHPLNRAFHDTRNVGSAFMDFLQYYSQVFQYEYVQMSFDESPFGPKDSPCNAFVVKDPVDDELIGKDGNHASLVRAIFFNSYKVMSIVLKSPVSSTKSLLSLWFGKSY